MANGCGLAIRPLGELASNFFKVTVDFMSKEKLEGKLRAAYRLIARVVGHDCRARTKWSRKSFYVARSSFVGEHALMYDGESTRRLSDSGKGIGTDLVDEAHSLGQSHIVTRAVGWWSSTTLAYIKKATRLTLEKKIQKATKETKREDHLPPT